MDRSFDDALDRPVDYGALDEGRHVNYWAYDPVLRHEVARTYDEDAFEWGRERLSSFGEAVGHTVADNSDVVDRHGPELHTYDAAGEVANEVEYHPAQFESERIVFEHGVLADGFRAPPGRDEPMPHTHSLAMLYLLTYADVGLTCPVAMTAGVALVLEKFDDGSLEEFLDGVTARDYDESMQGAMFLTERQGGSDVGATETTAERADDGTWRLTGEKWFCSNIDAEAALALARRPDAPEGTDGLSLFLLPRTKRDGTMNDVRYRRLKDKLGTVSVPTGEMELEGAEAYLVGDSDEGFRQMAEMLNLERLANAMGAMGLVGRALLESKVHAANREAFGSTIDRYPLMRADLVDMAVDHEAGTAFTFEAARQFDEREARSASETRAGRDDPRARERTGDDDAYRLMRLLVPIAKYRTGRLAVDTASYAMEVLGGNGYVADFVTERLLRDAQVLPIWEGTSNVLSLDVLRALDRDDAHEPLLSAIQARLDAVEHPILADDADVVRDSFHDLGDALATLATEDRDYAQLHAKRLADLVYDVFTAALLLEEAQDRLDGVERSSTGNRTESGGGDARKALVARRFVDRHLRDRDARGITSGDRLPDDHFDAIVRFASVAPEEVAEATTADD